jgi:hypothetical protein
MIDALAEWMTQPAYFSRYGGEPARRTGTRHPSISPYGPFNTRDGAGIANARLRTPEELTRHPNCVPAAGGGRSVLPAATSTRCCHRSR